MKLPKKTIKKILKENGIERISDNAVNLILKNIQELLEQVGFLAVRNAKHFGRKTINEKDVEFAFERV